MSSESRRTLGRFIWHDLKTSDPQTAIAFYAELFGWTIGSAPFGIGDTYSMFHSEHGGVAGIVPQEPGGIPSHWIGYVGVGDVGTAVREAKENGGFVVHAPMELPRVGSFAVIGHPSGGWISPAAWEQEALPPAFDGPPPGGRFCWSELLTPDTATAGEFYAKIFGWDRHEIDMGETGTYTIFRAGGKDMAGMMPMPPGARRPSLWLSYVAADDVDAAAAKVSDLGGTVFRAPGDIPAIGRFAVCGDPTGASFALFKGAQG